jgi:OmpA-OmpF porin, OOP family
MGHIKHIRKKQYVMKALLTTAIITSVALLASGCATKKYVRDTAAPIQAKVDQVGEQTGKNSQAIEETRDQVKDVDERAQSGISAAQERASTADQNALTADRHTGEAMSRADRAQQTADQNRQAIANIDDYKLQTSVSVPFRFNKYTLSNESKQDLDKLADELKADKRFFIAVEGYTDKAGSVRYNKTLSRRRADSVVEYLVAQHDVPIYRIHMIGLGEHKLVDEGRGRAANAKNRRVEVKVFSADQVTASLSPTSEITADRTDTEKPNQ